MIRRKATNTGPGEDFARDVVLVVDSCGQIQKLMKRCLSPYFDDVLTASTPEEAVRHLSNGPISHLVCESHLAVSEYSEKGDALRYATAWRREYRSIRKIVVFTGLGSAAIDRATAIDAVVEKNHGLEPLLQVLVGDAQCSAYETPDDELKRMFRHLVVCACRNAHSELHSDGVLKSHVLEIQAHLEEGAVLVLLRDFQSAISLYKTAASLAEKEQDKLLVLGCGYKIAFCYEQLRELDVSLEFGISALRFAETLSADERPNACVAKIGRLILRVLHGLGKEGDALSKDLRRRLDNMLGPAWLHRSDNVNQENKD